MALTVPDDPTDEMMAAVSELVEDAQGKKPYRIKLYDKRPALDALGRVLGLLPKTGVHEDEQGDEGDDPREKIIREIARLRAEGNRRKGAPRSQA